MGLESPSLLGIGLVGVGRHGSRYVQHLLHDVTGARLVAVCRKSGREVAPGHDIRVYSDYCAMIRDQRVDAVVVVTPPSLCHDICLTSVRAGKPILIEKPLAMTKADARAMVAAADQAGVLLMTAQTLRYDPTILLLKDRLPTIGSLRSGSLISHIETKANLLPSARGPVPIGAVLELGTHLFDLVRYLTGREILDVRCTMNPLSSMEPETLAAVQMHTVGGIDCALDIARVESDRMGTAEWQGEEGKLVADWIRRTVVRTTTRGVFDEWTVEPQPTVLATLRSFVGAIQTRTPPPISGLDGCRAVEVADACYQSAAKNGAVIQLDTG